MCVCDHSFACVYTQGLGTPAISQHNIFYSEKTFSHAPDRVGTSGLWISSPTLYQLSHPVTKLLLLPLPECPNCRLKSNPLYDEKKSLVVQQTLSHWCYMICDLYLTTCVCSPCYGTSSTGSSMPGCCVFLPSSSASVYPVHLLPHLVSACVSFFLMMMMMMMMMMMVKSECVIRQEVDS